MKYTFTTKPTERKEYSADKPRPVLDDGQYLVRIIHIEPKVYKEALNDKGEKLTNAGLKFVLAPVDQSFQDVRMREYVHIWHHRPDIRGASDRKLQMIRDFAGLPQSDDIETDDLIGRRVGVTVQRVTRFDDAGNRIEFNEIKRWHPGPDKQALSFSPKSDPNRTDAPSQDASFNSLFG